MSDASLEAIRTNRGSGYHDVTTTTDIECSSLFNSSLVPYHYLPSAEITYGSDSVSTLHSSGTSNAYVVASNGGRVDGYGIVIQWETTDTDVINWLASQTMSNSTAGPTASATQSPSPHSGIPAGSIAGIAVGAVAVLAFLIFGVWFFLRRRRRTQPNSSQGFPEQGHNNHANIAPEKGNSYRHLYTRKAMANERQDSTLANTTNTLPIRKSWNRGVYLVPCPQAPILPTSHPVRAGHKGQVLWARTILQSYRRDRTRQSSICIIRWLLRLFLCKVNRFPLTRNRWVVFLFLRLLRCRLRSSIGLIDLVSLLCSLLEMTCFGF
jgi:hypothetical protein